MPNAPNDEHNPTIGNLDIHTGHQGQNKKVEAAYTTSF
jgi:hypothetical protein